MTAEEYAEMQRAEYAKYVANQTIMFNGARAYNEGDPVPITNVEAYHYLESGLVRLVGDPPPEPPVQEPPPQGEDILLNPEPINVEKDTDNG